MTAENFVHLHAHSEYSLLDGITRVDSIPGQIKNLGQKAVALTDHGTVSGIYKFIKVARREGIKPIAGLEAYYTLGDRRVRDVDELGRRYYHLVLLAMNNEGLHNLVKLSSEAYNTGMFYKPRVDDELLGQYSEGIVGATACLGGAVAQMIMNDRREDAERVIDRYRELFNKRLLLELQPHNDEDQQLVNKVLMEIAAKRDMPLILTNDAHYLEKEDKILHEAVLCMKTKTKLSDENRVSYGDLEVYLTSHDNMWRRAQKHGIPYEAISNTRYVADMVDADDYFSDRMNRYPHYPDLPEGVEAWEELEYQSQRGLFEKFGGTPPQEYRDRLDHEIKVIKKMGFDNYMLIVKKLIDGARALDVPVGPGRGSAAGSLVAYALKITMIDPIEYGLIFERFLNQGRGATPLIFNTEMKAKINEHSTSVT